MLDKNSLITSDILLYSIILSAFLLVFIYFYLIFSNSILLFYSSLGTLSSLLFLTSIFFISNDFKFGCTLMILSVGLFLFIIGFNKFSTIGEYVGILKIFNKEEKRLNNKNIDLSNNFDSISVPSKYTSFVSYEKNSKIWKVKSEIALDEVSAKRLAAYMKIFLNEPYEKDNRLKLLDVAAKSPAMTHEECLTILNRVARTPISIHREFTGNEYVFTDHRNMPINKSLFMVKRTVLNFIVNISEHISTLPNNNSFAMIKSPDDLIIRTDPKYTLNLAKNSNKYIFLVPMIDSHEITIMTGWFNRRGLKSFMLTVSLWKPFRWIFGVLTCTVISTISIIIVKFIRES